MEYTINPSQKIEYPFTNFNKKKIKNPFTMKGYTSCSQTSVWGLNKMKKRQYIEQYLSRKNGETDRNRNLQVSLNNNYLDFN